MQFFPPIGEPVPSSHQFKHLMRFLCSVAFIFFLQCLHFVGIVVVHQAIQKSMVIIETLSLSLICLPHSSSAKIFGQCWYNTLKVSDVKTIHRNWKLCCCCFFSHPAMKLQHKHTARENLYFYRKVILTKHKKTFTRCQRFTKTQVEAFFYWIKT